MSKSICNVFITLAVFGGISTFVQGASYLQKGNWRYSLYTTTPLPPEFTSTTTATTPTPSPPSELTQDENSLNRFVIVADPKTGSVIYVPSNVFWQRFGSGNSIRQKRSTWKTSRAFQMKQPRLRLDEVPQIDDVIENDEFDEKYSDYLRSASQYQPQVYYDDNIAVSAEDQEVEVEVSHKDAPTWQPSDVFKAFFPNYRYNPNKIVYTYSSICANGCINNKKYYNPPPPAESIVANPSTTTTSTSTEAPTTSTTTTTEQPILEDAPTTENGLSIDIETTTISQSPDYVLGDGTEVSPA